MNIQLIPTDDIVKELSRRYPSLILELLYKATPGPWETYQEETLNTRVYSMSPKIRNVTVCRHPCASIQAKADAKLIAAMHSAFPALLAIADAAEAACDDGPFVDDACPMARLRDALRLLPAPEPPKELLPKSDDGRAGASPAPMHHVVGQTESQETNP